jgi:predicted HTH domain antitoxin
MEILEDRGIDVGYTEEDLEDDVSLVTNEE